MQARQGLLDQGDPELGHVPKVAVEPGRRHARLPGDLAHPEAAQILVLQQAQARIHQPAPALLLLGLSDPQGVTHIIQ
ncbi:hypothetical protein GCM10010193_39460 [Kitasatospora atroaurantiaca]